MSSSIRNLGVDMNNPTNLALYGQLVVFQSSQSKREFIRHNPDSASQRTLQALAHYLGLEFEYSLTTRDARISRPVVVRDTRYDFLDLGPYGVDNTPDLLGAALQDVRMSTAAFQVYHNDEVFNASQPDMPLFPVAYLNLPPPPPPPATSLAWPRYSEHYVSLYSENDTNIQRGSGDSSNPTIVQSNITVKSQDISEPLNSSQPGQSQTSTRSQPKFGRTAGAASNVRQGSLLSSRLPDIGTVPHVNNHLCNTHIQDYFERKSSDRDGIGEKLLAVALPGRRKELNKQMQDSINFGSSQKMSSPGRFASAGHQPYEFNSIEPNQNPSESSSFISFESGNMNDSRTGSIASDHSFDNSRNAFGGPSSVRSIGSSGFQQIVFDSTSIYSTGSHYSESSGRRGAMSRAGRTAMNAVRKIGACWKCKFSRQVCDTSTPCELCQLLMLPLKGSPWKSIGCKRGSIKHNMLPLHLCPVDASKAYFSKRDGLDTVNGRATYCNELLQKNLERREAELLQLGDAVSSVNYEGGARLAMLGVNSLQCFAGSRYSSVEAECAPDLIPLNECILAISWELSYQNLMRSYEEESQEGLIHLLRSAAVFQSKIGSDQLIAQSLICFRSCLEAMPLYETGACDTPVHVDCQPSQCKIECVANLNLHLGLYLDELSRVLFKKENMRNKNLWWLSVFYSLCIQSHVRNSLVALGNHPLACVDSSLTPDHSLQHWGIAQYLHVPIRLFTAMSGAFDPINSGLSSSDSKSAQFSGTTKVFSAEDVGIARTAVFQYDWEAQEIDSSFHYLKRLFEDLT